MKARKGSLMTNNCPPSTSGNKLKYAKPLRQLTNSKSTSKASFFSDSKRREKLIKCGNAKRGHMRIVQDMKAVRQRSNLAEGMSRVNRVR